MAPVGAIPVNDRRRTSIAMPFPANDELAVTELPDDPGVAAISIPLQPNLTLVVTIAIPHVMVAVSISIASITVAVLIPIPIADADLDLCQHRGFICVRG
jgi:hypothetical protein